METTVVEVEEHTVEVVEQFGHLNTDVARSKAMSHDAKLPTTVDSAQKVDDSAEKGWWDVQVGDTILMQEVLALKPVTFARGSIPRIAWFANTVVSSNSIEA